MTAEPVQLTLDAALAGADDGEPEGGPTPEQRAAIASRDRDVFCEAGAGTGKTRVLVERYCEAVISDGAGPEEILAFTFTERAAAELRTRIRRELTARAAAARERGEADLAARLARAARDTERAWVTTIHGFCRRLLAAHPGTAGLDPRFRVLDESEASRLRHRARDAAIDDVLRGGDRERTEVVAAYQAWRLGEMTVAAYERLRSQGLAKPALPPVREPTRSIRDPDKDEPALSPAERERALRARDTLVALLEAFHDRYERLKAERAGLDFADLELRARDLLGSAGAVETAWRGRFAHLMVDEFQDTNAVQLELIEALRGAETRVFTVGDELQSIYRFRNADLAVFRAERERAERDPGTAIQPLTGNFRSRAGVVGAVNVLGEALVGERFRPLAHNRPEPPSPAPATELLLTLDTGRSTGWPEHAEALAPPPSESQPKIVAEARALARRLRELVDSGEARPGEIVVLLRAFTHVDAFEEALDRTGLDPYVVGGRGYWSQQQVEDLLRLLSTVANPLDDEMLLGALASPACGVSPDALWLLRRATAPDEPGGDDEDDRDERAAEPRRRRPGHLWPLVAWRFGAAEHRPDTVAERWLEPIDDADLSALERFCERLGQLRAAAPLLPLDELVERTMTAFGYDLALLARRGGRGRMANVRKLIRLARDFEAHEGRDLRAFLSAAEELTTRDEREGLAATQPEDHDGVRIMTVHAAKGLEFPVVAVPDLGRRLAQGERPGDVVIGRADDGGGAPERFGLRLVLPDADSVGVWELHELYSEGIAEAADEGARLVHVAATRAEERLILSGTFGPRDLEPKDREPNDTPLRRLLPRLVELGWDGEGEGELALPPPAAGAGAGPAGPARLAIRLNRPGAARAAELAERLEPAVPPAAADSALGGVPPLARPARVVPVGHLSYSALADYERCAYRFYIERLLGLGEPPAPLHPEATEPGPDPEGGAASALPARERRLALGNVVHAALEWSARHSWERPSPAALAALAAEQGVGGGDEMLERAEGLIDGWLGSELRRELSGLELRAEVPFAIALAGTIVRGQIDLLAAGEAPVVVDYKTDALGDAGPGDLASRYAAQRELYALAAAAAGDGSRTGVRAVHCFLEAPDDPVLERFDADRLDAARGRLEGLIGEIRGGGFEPTPEPSWQVCNGCPAAARLCPHPGWRPPRPRATEAPA
ncbi:MAG TPA: UvrD-helicase domain-containing protein [Solirubrobacterales bacterium]|nr:UvrD-helicase domain-containing protein [Solirubrobacterales bacterium]